MVTVLHGGVYEVMKVTRALIIRIFTKHVYLCTLVDNTNVPCYCDKRGDMAILNQTLVDSAYHK